jgi:hypothetical protein
MVYIIYRQTKVKRAESVAQVGECLPSKHKFLSTNSNTTKKRENNLKYFDINKYHLMVSADPNRGKVVISQTCI